MFTNWSLNQNGNASRKIAQFIFKEADFEEVIRGFTNRKIQKVSLVCLH